MAIAFLSPPFRRVEFPHQTLQRARIFASVWSMNDAPLHPEYQARAIETLKSATASTLRAMAGRKGLEVAFSAAEIPDRTGSADTKDSRLPDLGLLSPESRTILRGASDFRALWLRDHDEAAHRRMQAGNALAQGVFDSLEQVRCAAHGAAQMPGAGANIGALLEERCRRLGYDISGASGFGDGSLPDAIAFLAWARLTGRPAPRGSAALVEGWRPWLDSVLGPADYESLRAALGDQAAFAAASRRILGKMGLLEGEEEGGEAPDSAQGQGDSDPGKESGDSPDSETEQSAPKPDRAPEGNEAGGGESGDSDPQAHKIGVEGEISGGPLFEATGNAPPVLIESYRVFTAQFDETVDAPELADSYELIRLREQLDGYVEHHAGVVTKLANRLQRKLMARQTRRWQFDLDEGLLDPARLARIVANPTIPLTYKLEKETDFRDTVVSLLIDNSGSMRGRPIAIAAITTDILARTLERCGVKVEILGFTTRSWKGGRSRDLWLAQGRPENPGRLNDLRHIIYKSADAPWRRTRRNLGLMLKEGLLKENIDGEALIWAYNRIARRPEQRKILMVISDGAPVDDSTLAANPGNILEQDLHNVVSWIERRGRVELTAIGIGHDVSRYYRKAMTISDAGELAKALTVRLDEVFSQ